LCPYIDVTSLNDVITVPKAEGLRYACDLKTVITVPLNM